MKHEERAIEALSRLMLNSSLLIAFTRPPGPKPFTYFRIEEYNPPQNHTTDGGDKVNQESNQQMQEMTATELKERLDRGDDVQVIDVREQNEYDTARLPDSKLIPLGQVVNRMSEIDSSRETVVHCKMGGRSAKAIEALRRAGFTGTLINLKGGITAWSNEVDPGVPKY